MKKILCLFVLSALIISSSAIYVSASEIYSYEKTVPISSGVTLTKVQKFYSDRNISYSYITADITDENIRLKLLTPENGINKLDTVFNMAESEDNTAAAINADFFSSLSGGNGFSLGIEIKDGELLQSPIQPDTMATVYKTEEGLLMSYLDFHIMAVAPNWEYFEIRHLNKQTSYYGDILMYTSEYGDGMSPAPGGEVVEVVVEDGIITEFRRNMPPFPIPENGCVLVVSEGVNMFFANNFQVGDPIKFDYYITPDLSEAEFAFGGGAMLVSEGEALKDFSHKITGYNPRSAIGTDESMTKIYLVAVDGRQESSKGMTMSELALLMKELGCYYAVNLDGGGSTSMVASTITNPSLHYANSPTEKRKVINAIGIIRNAEIGEPDGVIIECDTDALFIGERATLSAHLYDENSNPTDGEISWSADGGICENGVFTANREGYANIYAESNDVGARHKIYVVDKISGIVIDDEFKMEVGQKKSLNISVFDNLGHYVPVTDFSSFNITSSNPYVASYENGVITAKSEGSAILTVSRGNCTSYASVTVGLIPSLRTDSFEEINGEFSSYPAYVGGDFSLSDKYVLSGESAGCLFYDFTAETTDSKAAYYMLTTPETLYGREGEISVNVYTEKDFNHEIRALLKDSKGENHRVVLGSGLTKDKWHHLKGSLPQNATLPLELVGIYALWVDGEEFEDGTLYFDDLSYTAGEVPEKPALSQNIYNDPKNTDSDYGETFRIAAVTDGLDSLIERSSSIALMKKFNNSGFALLGKSANDDENKVNDSSYKALDDGTALYISLDTSKGGIRATKSSQWDKMKEDIEKSDSPFLFIFSENKLSGSEFENKVLCDFLASVDKEVVVVTKADRNSLTIRNGVRYFTLCDIKAGASLSSRISSYKYLEFNLNDTLSYRWINLW